MVEHFSQQAGLINGKYNRFVTCCLGPLSLGSVLRCFVAIRESFLREIWGRGVLWHGKNEQSAKIFSTKIVAIFHQFAKIFSLESYPLYGDHQKLPSIPQGRNLQAIYIL